MTRILWRHRYAVRLGVRFGVALALAGLLGQPVGALGAPGNGGGGSGGDVNVTFSTDPVAPGLQHSTLTMDARTPYPNPSKPTAAPGDKWSPDNSYKPAPGGTCSTSYSAGISLAPESNGVRVATWTTAGTYLVDNFGTYDPAKLKPANGKYMLVSTAAKYDLPSWDGQGVAISTGFGLPGIPDLAFAVSNAGQVGQVVTYALKGTFQPDSLGVLVCVIDNVAEAKSTGKWCGRTQMLWNNGCSLPPVSFVASPQPPCSTNCVMSPQAAGIDLGSILQKAKDTWTNGGTVVASPRANMELVQLPATFTVTGGPVDTPTQYLELQATVGGPVTIGVVTYQVRLSYAKSDFYLDNLEPPYGTEQICSGVTVCSTTKLKIGRFALRVVDNFSIDIRSGYYRDYPNPGVVTPWTSFGSGFQLCAGLATQGLPSCGPGVNPVIFGQVEAIPVS